MAHHFTDDEARGFILDFYNDDPDTVTAVGPMTLERFRDEIRDMDVDSIITLVQYALDFGYNTASERGRR